MVNPVEERSCFAMLVYKNGSLARERVRDEVRAAGIVATPGVPPGTAMCIGAGAVRGERLPLIETPRHWNSSAPDTTVREAVCEGPRGARVAGSGRCISHVSCRPSDSFPRKPLYSGASNR